MVETNNPLETQREYILKMANQIILKRSSTPGKAPTAPQLALGEIAINTHDGKIFIKKDNGVASVVEIGGVTSINTKSGDVVLSTSDVDEGSNQYFTNARARSALSAGTGINFNSGTGVISTAQNLTTTGTPTFAGATVAGDLTVHDIIPSASNTYDLGSAANPFRHIFVGPGSLYVNGKQVLTETSGTMTFTADEDQNMRITTTGSGLLQLGSGTTGVNIDGTMQIAAGKRITSSDGVKVQFGDDIELNNNKIVGVGTPSALTDAATKGYVDTSIAAISTSSITQGNSNVSVVDTGTGAVTVTVDGSTALTVTGTGVVIAGNMTVEGTTTTVNSNTVSIADNIITLNSDATGAPTQNAGIEVERGDEANVQLRWNEGSGKWTFTNDGASYNTIAASTTDLTEGTNQYFTTGRARTAISANTASGVGYNSASGLISLNAIPNSSLTNNSITINGAAVALGGSRTLATDDVAEGVTNQYFTAARARGAISAGTGISYNSTTGAISATGYTLPTATTVALGGVKVDGTSITIASGVISAAGYTLPTASASTLGGVKVDGTTVTISNGVISAVGGSSGTTLPSQTGNSGKYLTTDGSTLSWGTVSGGSGSGGTTTNAITIGNGLSTQDGDKLFTWLPSSSSEYVGSHTATNGTYTLVVVANNSNGYVNVYKNSTGVLQYKISISSTSVLGKVAINSNNIIALADSQNSGTQAGRVLVFDMSTWTAYSNSTITITSATTTIDNPTSGSYSFGKRALAMSSSYIVIGCDQTTVSGSSTAGAVYLYSIAGALKYKITNPNSYGNMGGDQFGYSVDISNNTLVVGAYAQDDATTGADGTVYVFNIANFPAYSGTTVNITSSNYTSYGFAISVPDPIFQVPAYLGYSVATNGTYVIAGAPMTRGAMRPNQTTKQWVGSVYVFNATTGSLVYKFNSPSVLSHSQGFGSAVAASGNNLLVGEAFADAVGFPGVAYMFNLTDGKLKKTIYSPNAVGAEGSPQTDYFGSTVSLSGNYAAIGAPGEQRTGQASSLGGAAYLFNVANTFDGSAATTIALAPTSVVPGSYGYTDGSSYINVPQLTVDGYGRIVNATTLQFGVTQGIDHAFGAILVDGAEAFVASSVDAINFAAGDNVTLATSVNGQGQKTITISSTGGGSGTSGGTFSGQLMSWEWMSPEFRLQFSNPADVATFLANVGSNPVTISGFSGSQYMSPGSTLTVTATSGWMQYGGSGVRSTGPMVTPSIPSWNDMAQPGGTATFSYGGSSGGNPADYFLLKMGPSASSINGYEFTVTSPAQAGKLFIYDPYISGGAQVMNINAMGQPISFQHVSGQYAGTYGPNGQVYPWYSMSSVPANTTLSFNLNTYASGMASVSGFVLDSSTDPSMQECQIGSSSGYLPGGSGNIVVSPYPQMNNNTYWSNPGWCYGQVYSQGGDPTALSSFTAAPGVTAYYDPTLGMIFFRCPASVWNGSGAIGSIQGTNGMSLNYQIYAVYFGSY